MPKILIKPLATPSIDRELTNAYDDMVKNKIVYTHADLSRFKTIRASQQPFCPLAFLLNCAKRGPVSQIPFHMGFFTRVGTEVHNVMEEYLCTNGSFFARWECRDCGKTWVGLNNTCCGTIAKYHEIKVDHPLVVGHVDAIYKDSNDRYWIVDFKTTSVNNVENVIRYPGTSYVMQLQAYALALRSQYKLDIAGIANLFILRDNPTKPHIWSQEITKQDFADTKKRLVRYRKLHRMAYVAKSMDDLKEVWRNRMCKPHEVDELAGYCDYKDSCRDGDPYEAISIFKNGRSKRYIPIARMVKENET